MKTIDPMKYTAHLSPGKFEGATLARQDKVLPAFHGFTLIGEHGWCHKHQCAIFSGVKVLNGRKWSRYICKECLREAARRHRKSWRERYKKKVARGGYHCRNDAVAGKVDVTHDLWSKEADRRIDEFWKKRGINPAIKFRYRVFFEKPFPTKYESRLNPDA